MQLTLRILDEPFKVTNLFLHFLPPRNLTSTRRKDLKQNMKHTVYSDQIKCCTVRSDHLQSSDWPTRAHVHRHAACCLGACTSAGSFRLRFSIISAFTFISYSLSHYLSIQAQIANPLKHDWKCGCCK